MRRVPRSPALGPLVFGGVLLLLPGPRVQAHEYWLSPARYDVARRQVVSVGALAGTGFRGEWKPWAPSRVVRFVARTDRDLDLVRGARPGETPWVEFEPADDGGTMLGYESTFTPIQLPAAEFDAYLLEEGLAAPLAARRASGGRTPGRERYRRCAKTWLAGSDARRATTPIGLPLEIVPLAPPGSPNALRVRVLAKGRPLAGARVRAWRSPFDAGGQPRNPATRDPAAVAAEATTDTRGEAVLRCDVPGEWMLSVVAMEPSRDRSVADWESTWSSLTFARRGEGNSASRLARGGPKAAP